MAVEITRPGRVIRTQPALPSNRGRRALVLSLIGATGFLISQDVSLHSVAVSTLLQQLGDRDVLEFSLWIPKSYVLSLIVFLLIGGVLTDRCGAKRVLVAGCVTFLAGLVAHMLLAATSIPLLVARIVMGAGVAAIVPASLSILVLVSNAGRQRAQALLLWAGCLAAGVTVVPLVSGLLLNNLWWPRVALADAVVAVALLAGIVKFVPRCPGDPQAPVDWPSVVAATVGSGLVALGLLKAPDWGWTAVPVIVLLGSGTVLLVLAAATRRGGELPHDILLRADPRAQPAMFALSAAVVAEFGIVFVTIQYLQAVRGTDPVVAGALIFLPACVASAAGAKAGAVLQRRTGATTPLIIGLTMVLDGLAVGLTADAAGSLERIVGMVAVMSVGMGIVMAVALDAIGTALPSTRNGVLFAAQSAVVQLGSLLGLAVAGGLVDQGYRAGLVIPAKVAAHEGIVAVGQPLGMNVATAASVGDTLGGPLARAVQNAFLVGYRQALLATIVVVVVMMLVIGVLTARARLRSAGNFTSYQEIPKNTREI
ncbi:MFS transporter [Nocardia amamiensis]|uniref:MFS transporter n=1 Tax=Nocardia amamiensis TaxID=404578 RepID=A0ABS0D0Q7_9NOCA|nr:MFS transporter [Nocardia amamiensis]MBF6302425.1 MFS transporter [Nocardia amamiensis]